ncbi:unnamed protein product [Zymoseptoria tritici ST99CH_1A5]|uniref:CENP-V/GFA domain-containing protein n=1 Tax=Zymoseptoria tritici ST99CH_1A5 TaxID=1276529 RepID=A0A1Y6LZN3_ZYMTR|nr:unnamed protein product [Zymoseptoria tritici ST99CH_1A5]
MASTRTGRCLCGKIQYELKGESAKPLYNTICHCLNCQRASGTAFLSASICPKPGFKVTAGSEYQKSYIDNATDSGTNLERVFCSNCGTKLFAYTPLFEPIVSVAAGTLDDCESWKPDTEQWCIHRVDFVAKMEVVEKDRTFKRAARGEIE